MPDGKGIFSNAYGLVYDGEVTKGFYNGQGKAVYINNDIYVGEFKMGLRDGYGTYSTATKVIKGRFVNDEYAEATDYTKYGNGNFTNYDLASTVFSSDGRKIAVTAMTSYVLKQSVKIFDVATGKLIERVNIKTPGCENIRSAIKFYLDFGTEYTSSVYGIKNLLTKFDKEFPNDVHLFCPYVVKDYAANKISNTTYMWNYAGKSATGAAIFWLYVNTKDRVSETFAISYKNANAEPEFIWRKPDALFWYDEKAISVDLHKVVLTRDKNETIIVDIDPVYSKKEPKSIRKITINAGLANPVFTPDGVRIYFDNLVYEMANGNYIGYINTPSNRLKSGARILAFSNDMMWYVSDIQKITSAGVLVCILSTQDQNYLLPLIDPQENYFTIDATDQTIGRDIRYRAESEKKKLLEWEAKYGKVTTDDYTFTKKTSPQQNSTGPSETNHTCSVCFGSGRVVDEMQSGGLYQDPTSGRWYKQMGTVYRNCIRCNGRGYVTY